MGVYGIHREAVVLLFDAMVVNRFGHFQLHIFSIS